MVDWWGGMWSIGGVVDWYGERWSIGGVGCGRLVGVGSGRLEWWWSIGVVGGG